MPGVSAILGRRSYITHLHTCGHYVDNGGFAAIIAVGGPRASTKTGAARPLDFCIDVSRGAEDEWIVVYLGFDVEYWSVRPKSDCAGPAGRNDRCPRVS
jgi:hypothetical protein